MLGIRNVALKQADDSIVSGCLLTVESKSFLKSPGAASQVYETGQYTPITPDEPLIGSSVRRFWGGSSPWRYEVIYINHANTWCEAKESPPALRWPRCPIRWTSTSTPIPPTPR